MRRQYNIPLGTRFRSTCLYAQIFFPSYMPLKQETVRKLSAAHRDASPVAAENCSDRLVFSVPNKTVNRLFHIPYLCPYPSYTDACKTRACQKAFRGA
jgi:hypothetical protein